MPIISREPHPVKDAAALTEHLVGQHGYVRDALEGAGRAVLTAAHRRARADGR